MKLNNDHMVYLKAKEKSLDKIAMQVKGLIPDAVASMLSLGKAKGSSLLGINRTPVHDLYGSLSRSGDIGRVVSEVSDLSRQALLGRDSIKNSYSGILNSGSSSPLSLLRKAREKVYSPLGNSYAHSGSTLKEVASREIEESIFKALATQAHQPEVAKYAKNLVENRGYKHSELNSQIKKVMNDFAEGKDPSILIKNGAGDGRHLNLAVDRPIASFNGAPVLNIKKTMGFDGVESFNAKHLKLENKMSENMAKGKEYDYLLGYKLEKSKQFAEHFGDKLRLMSNSADDVNRSKFTLDDIDTVEKVKVFFQNPLIDDAQKFMPDYNMGLIADDIVNHVKKATRFRGDKPANIKEALSQKLSSIAGDPDKANFMQSFQFERYSPDEMKTVMEAVRGTKRATTDEAIRIGADALGIAALTGATGIVGYNMLKPKEGLQHELQQL